MEETTIKKIRELMQWTIEEQTAFLISNKNQTEGLAVRNAVQAFRHFLNMFLYDQKEDQNDQELLEKSAAYLMCLLSHTPICPILDRNWVLHKGLTEGENKKYFYNERWPSLYKLEETKEDGSIKTSYTDVRRGICIDLAGEVYDDPIVYKVFDEVIPITFPYDLSVKYKIYADHFEKEGVFTAIGILYIDKVGENEKIPVKRFFLKTATDEIKEITKEEYFHHLLLKKRKGGSK